MKKSLTAVCLASLLATVAPAALAAEFPTLETTGVAELKVTPDTAVISVEVQSRGDTPKYVKGASDKAVAGFIRRLEEAGVKREQIESANLIINPEYKYHKDAEPQLVGYSANRRVTVRISDLARVNDILDSALTEGINRVGDISFELVDDSAARAKVRELAILDARSKAESLAKGFGSDIDKVWNIRYFEQGPVRPVMYKAAAMEADNAAVGASYQSGDITLSDRVEVTYRLRD
ncbi:SIMPL domain-containing protein [Shewanella sp. JM162201]|uniref:SIMPL domain-containing protein n=1 Tax=Shewanella jiangmenensis TaxID=2837387 RepID=A0ABS5V0J2_9GAMM|nr:SIMPL domain-containing protein [Shewanella jiangmenensis]MBT1443979.1 SIMPL domain-containing protein [Shewanella jiangmenensis]